MSWRWVVSLLVVAGLAGGCSKKDEEKAAGEKRVEPTAAEAASLPAPAELPPGVMGWVAAGNPAGLMRRIEKLASRVTPVPAGALSAMVHARLQRAGLKDTRVVDLEAPAGLVLLDPNKHRPPLVAAVHTRGRQKVLAALAPVCRPGEAAGPVLELVCETIDEERVFERGGGDEARQVSSVFVRFEDGVMFVAPAREALQAGHGVLSSRLTKNLPAAGLAGALRVDALRSVYREELAGLPSLLGRAMEQDPALAAGQDLERMRWMMEWMANKAIALVEQTRGVQLALAVDDQAAVARIGVVPEKDSFFQEFLGVQKKAPLGLAKALPADHFLAMAFNLQWKPFQDELVSFSREIMHALLGMELTEEYVELMKQMLEVMGDEMAMSENLSEDGLVVYELIGVEDQDRAQKVIDRLMAMTPALVEQAGGGMMGIKVRYQGPDKLGEHDGVALQVIDMIFDTGEMPAGQAAAMNNLYGGDRMRMAYALFDKRFGMVLGKDAGKGLSDLIDRARGKGAGKGLVVSEAFRAAAGGLERDAGCYVFISLSGMVEAGLRSTYATMGRKPPPTGKAAPRSGLFMAFSSTPRRMTTTLRLPADHLEELGLAIKTMMQGQTRP